MVTVVIFLRRLQQKLLQLQPLYIITAIKTTPNISYYYVVGVPRAK